VSFYITDIENMVKHLITYCVSHRLFWAMRLKECISKSDFEIQLQTSGNGFLVCEKSRILAKYSIH
jgi:hypothetical protein